MREYLKKHKSLISIIAIILVLVVMSVGVLVGIYFKNKSATGKNNSDEKVTFNFYERDVEKIDDAKDMGVMLLACDKEDEFGLLKNGWITRESGEYVQGTGALIAGSMQRYSSLEGLFRRVDISEYETGSLHLSIYVNEPDKIGTAITLEFSSSGSYDLDEMSWNIPAVALESGWNELYLSIPDAVKAGEIDFTGVNYFRLRTPETKVGVTLIIDNVYATDTEASSLDALRKPVAASTKSGYLMDCDTLSGLKKNDSCILSINEAGGHKEGKGALAINNFNYVSADLQEADISAYKDGNLCFWLYVNDEQSIKDVALRVELTSSGVQDVEELSWVVQGSGLKSGWNNIRLSLASAGRTVEDIDLTKVNFFRIWTTNAPKSLMMFLDAVHMEHMSTRIATDGKIADCDSLSGMSVQGWGGVFSLTSEKDEYKEGTGAVKGVFEKDHPIQFEMNFYENIDISAYTDGSLRFWLHVDDVSKLGGAIRVELSSAGYDILEHQWALTKSSLTNGWNEVTLNFAAAGKSADGGLNFNKVSRFRMYVTENSTDAVTLIVDDIRAEHMSTRVAAGGKVLSCDSLLETGVQGWGGAFDITSKSGEYKEGTGAIKGVFEKDAPIQMELNFYEYVDISAYSDGSLKFWLYVDDVSKLGGAIRVELSSAGQDSLEHQWPVYKDNLTNGWNEINLRFSDAGKSKDGGVDFVKVSRFRLYITEKSTGEVTFILDDIRVAEKPSKPAPVPGMILSCDDTDGVTITGADNYSITTKEGEYKEGTGAFKSKGTGPWRWCEAILDKPMDISEYADGSLHMWLYVEDVTKLKANSMKIQLGSGGAVDTDVHQWSVALESGWNELTLNFADAELKNADLSKINYFRIWRPANEVITVIVDDVRVIPGEEEEPSEPVPGMILNFDNANGVTIQGAENNGITTTDGEYKEGTGAFKSTGTGPWRWCEAILDEPMDISEYADGSLHMWLYVEDVAKLRANSMKIQLGSGGAADTDVHQWSLALESGWNELTLKFADAELKNADLSKINYFRLWRPANEDITVIVDDVRVVAAEEPEDPQPVEPIPGMILSCDGTDGVTIQGAETNGITTTAGEFKEGTGAFKSTGAGSWRWCEVVWSEALDLSEYASGSLHMWLYVEDVTKLQANSMKIQLGSGGAPDTDVYQWSLALENGWNELTLDFAKADVKDGDLSKINYFRILRPANEAITVIVDDVRAVVTTQQTDNWICSYLRSGAIYQANKPFAVWGSASIGTEIKVELYEGTHLIDRSTLTTTDAAWNVELPGQSGSYAEYTVKVYENDSLWCEYDEILFGEVWLSAGQSNMQLMLCDSYHGAEQFATANDSYLRVFQAKSMPEGNEAAKAPASDIEGRWILGQNSDINLKGVSAVAYNFALGLREELDVPVAILETSLGSTPIEAWLSKEMVDTNAELKAEMQRLGVYKTPTTYTELGAMYYSKIAPLTNANIAGVVWYQGESNVARASIYAEQLDLLKAKWGLEFGFENDSMPFVFTQLAPYSFSNSQDQMLLTRMMDEMSEFYMAHEGTTAMVTNYDISLQYTDTTSAKAAVIHPTVKKPVGERMALAALGLVYGKEEATAPTLASVEMNDGKAVLTFEHVGTGLKVYNDSIGVLGFALCDEKGIWVNATAEIINATTVHVYNEYIDTPLYVSYAYCDMNTDANLCASNGIPAAPFKTGGTGGFGSRSYLNCDGEVFVVTSFATTATEVGHGEYKNLWTVLNRATATYNADTYVQGIASVKGVYEAGTGEVVVGVDLTEAGQYSVTTGLKNIGAIAVRIKNGDARNKEVRLGLETSDGTLVYTDTKMLVANADFDILDFDLTRLFYADGSEVEDYVSVCIDTKKISFCIADGEAGTIWFDDMKLKAKTNSEEPQQVPGMILNFDTVDGLNIQGAENNGVTTVDGEYKEGTGAFKSYGLAPWRWCEVVWSETLNLSEYANGSLHMWLYVEDVTKLKANSMKIQLGSDGTAAVNRYEWNLALQNGWNELTLDFANADVKDGDLSKINYFRIFRPANEATTVIVDDVRVVK